MLRCCYWTVFQFSKLLHLPYYIRYKDVQCQSHLFLLMYFCLRNSRNILSNYKEGHWSNKLSRMDVVTRVSRLSSNRQSITFVLFLFYFYLFIYNLFIYLFIYLLFIFTFPLSKPLSFLIHRRERRMETRKSIIHICILSTFIYHAFCRSCNVNLTFYTGSF